jgi:biotin carboxyl carrier protein
MFVRSIFASYNRLLAGIMLAVLAITLGGCNELAAEKVAPSRPVLVATVHYEAESPERSFVGTIKPRIETDMGFRVPGKVAKRLVEVGQTVDIGQPLATLDEVDLKLQAEQADAELHAATGVLAQAAAAEQRAKDLRTKGWTTDAQLDQAKAAADEARARLNRAQRSVELTNNSLSYATLVADTRGVVTATLIDAGQVVASGQTAIPCRALRGKGSRGRDPGDTVGPRQGRRRNRDPLVGAEQEVCRKTARDCARGRSRDPHLSGKVFAARRGRERFARHDCDPCPCRSRHRTRRAAAVVGPVQPGRQSLALHRRCLGRRHAEAGRGQSYESNDVVISGGVDEGAKVVALGVQRLDPTQKVRVVSSLSF